MDAALWCRSSPVYYLTTLTKVFKSFKTTAHFAAL